MAKMSNKMIALCSLAVGAVYTSGYIVTATDSNAAQASETKSASPSQTHSNTNQPSHYHEHFRDRSYTWDGHHGDRHRSQQNSTPNSSNGTSGTTQQPSNSGSTQTNYKDGTYTGVGTNGIGSVQVAVKISQGKIASVSITNCTTSYPESNIDPLPAEVVSKQSANVDNVSGATRSTEDFQNAVQMALDKAKA